MIGMTVDIVVIDTVEIMTTDIRQWDHRGMIGIHLIIDIMWTRMSNTLWR